MPLAGVTVEQQPRGQVPHANNNSACRVPADWASRGSVHDRSSLSSEVPRVEWNGAGSTQERSPSGVSPLELRLCNIGATARQDRCDPGRRDSPRNPCSQGIGRWGQGVLGRAYVSLRARRRRTARGRKGARQYADGDRARHEAHGRYESLATQPGHVAFPIGPWISRKVLLTARCAVVTQSVPGSNAECWLAIYEIWEA